jgi:hypothetical protein
VKIIRALVIFFSLYNLCYSDIKESEYVPLFYQLLFQDASPSIKNEIEFFSDQQNDRLREVLLTKADYKNSKTPIWSFVRNNPEFFVTKNVKNIDKLRLHYSEPFTFIRMWNKTKWPEKKVWAMFATEKSLVGGGSSGMSSIMFTLGEKSYLNICSTINYKSGIFFSEIYSK